jgi:nitrite reductase/ring-hydroxylating ferredoxin subunit
VTSVRQPTFVGRVGDIAPGRSKKFLLQCGTHEVEAFVVNHRGDLHAYVNRCCHVPMTMDWVDNQFFTEDGCYIQCATHGAWYEPASGECVAGPPVGKCLTRVPLTIRDGEVYAEWPGEEA